MSTSRISLRSFVVSVVVVTALSLIPFATALADGCGTIYPR
jgi:hypothetical protein